MKPNKPIDRESLLRLIRQSVDQATSAHAKSNTSVDQTDGPLGLAVRQIMATVSSDSKDSSANNTNLTPVPLFEVAAYVDNMMIEPDKVQAITDAAVLDPGLMMEIVSAVTAGRQPPTPNLSQDLRSRLIGLQRQTTVATASKPAEERVDSIPDAIAGAASITVTPQTRPKNRVMRSRMMTLGLAATAAALLLVVGWWYGSTFGDRDIPIAKDDQVTSPIVPLENPETTMSEDPLLVESPLPPSDPVDIPKPERVATPGLAPGPKVPGEIPVEIPVEKIANDPVPILDASPGTIIEMPDESETAKEPTRLVANWNQVDGLLLQSDAPGAASTNSSSKSRTLRTVSEGTTLELAGSGKAETLQLQTLPLCRASATLAGGGKLVLAADTQIQLTHDGVINLQHGSLALMPPGEQVLGEQSTIWLGKNLSASVPIQRQAGATVLVRKTASGIEVDITGTAVTVGQQTYSNSRLNIDDNLLAVRRVGDAPERLPRWTRQRVDRIELGRTVLAQFASSTDIQATMMQSLRSDAVRGKSATTIRGWLVSSSGDNFSRMIASHDPLIRDAALSYLRMVTPEDPRHQEVWRRLQAKNSNPRAIVAIRSYFLDVWANRRPDATRRGQLLRMVQSNDAATQVAANYLLTVFYGTGPRFQLGANANTKTRAITAWRTIISRAGL